MTCSAITIPVTCGRGLRIGPGRWSDQREHSSPAPHGRQVTPNSGNR